MSALFTRLAELHRRGHAADIELHHDTRVAPSNTGFRPAAVLAAITERDRPGILLIHRPSTMRAHPGQVAFPGGKIDPGEGPVEAALREAHEELGIASEQVRVIGEGDIYFTGSGYEITPVIGLVPPDMDLIPNPTEVAQWFEAPLDFVLDPRSHTQREFEKDGVVWPVWEIQWHEHRIWGVTAGLIVNLARRLNWHG
ncbi:MAG: CoA pyrophosphatase [Pseudomonadota bacterium]